MTTLSLFESMESWTHEQLLAVHDLCQQMAETIWQHHSDTLIDYLRREEHNRRFQRPTPAQQENLSLPFDDELPF